jgi:hypothetical protein
LTKAILILSANPPENKRWSTMLHPKIYLYDRCSPRTVRER